MAVKLPGGGQAGSDGKLLGIRFNPSGIITGLRDELGKYQNLSGRILDAHREMADKLQQTQLRILKESIQAHRRAGVQRSSHYLENALKSDKYTVVSREGFVVNPEGYLDSTRAKAYWRHIEEGYEGFVGDTFMGYFQTGSRRRGPGAWRDIELIQVVPAIGRQGEGNRGTKSNPIKKIPVGRSAVVGEDNQGNRGVGGDLDNSAVHVIGDDPDRETYLITIKNPIPAYEFLSKGVEEWNARFRPLDIYRDHGIPISA